MDESPLVSVVVPTFNEERNLPRLLASLARQEGVRHECVVADQYSSDATPSIAQSFGCTFVEVERPPFYTPPGRSRNRGADVARGTVLVHLDADMELPSVHTLASVVAAIDASHQAVVIHETDVAEGFWSRCKALERECYRDTNLEAARCVTRRLFDTVGGYDEDIGSGEDIFISRRYSSHTKIRSAPGGDVFHHTGRQTLVRMLRKKFNYGRTVPVYVAKATEAGDASRTFLVRACLIAYVRNWRAAFRHPLLFLAMFPMRLLEFGAVAMGALVGRVRPRRTLESTRIP